MRTIDILVLEGERATAERARRGLRGLANVVDVVTDPEEAARLLVGRVEDGGARPYELVILDADLLGPECWAFVRELRGGAYGGTEIVVVSEDPDWEQLESAQEAGASRFEQTPLTLDDLAALIAHVHDMDLHVVRQRVPAMADGVDGEGAP